MLTISELFACLPYGGFISYEQSRSINHILTRSSAEDGRQNGMKKKKLEAKLAKAQEKFTRAKTELDALLAIMEESGMPKASSKPAAGKKSTPSKKAAPSKAKPKAKTKAVKKAA